MRYINYLLLLYSPLVFSKAAKLATKQSINNIRFISSDGKYTYYSRRSGDLIVSTNFNAKVVIKGERGDHYIMTGNTADKTLVVQSIKQFHHRYSPTRPHMIYVLNFDGTELKKIGPGKYPKLHMNGKWLSYMDFEKRQIVLQNLEIGSQKYKIQLRGVTLPLYNPARAYIDLENFIYTDNTTEGNIQVIRFNPLRKTFIKQLSFPKLAHVEMCFMQNNLYLFMGNDPEYGGSKIFKFSALQEKLVLGEPVYSNSFRDIGGLICSKKFQSLFLIRGYINLKSLSYDLFEINPDTGKETQLTEFRHVYQAFTMDDQLLLHHNGEVYVAKGRFSRKDFKLEDNKEEKK